ncbi:MAG: DUF4142 domain-containing protein [Pseudomonadota bacterium]|nr:DUF4142 domain-containing protein [Pseudomonadota bacterium]
MKRRLLFIASTLVLSACSNLGLPNPLPFGRDRAPVGPLSAPSPATDAYLRAAGESDLYEITSSQLALQRTQDPRIRRFATRVIAHHTSTTNALLKAAAAAGAAPPPVVLGPAKRAMIDELNGQAGWGFDRLYLQQQATAHEEALAVHAGYAASGDTPPVRAAAAAAVPVVQRHLGEVRAMRFGMGGMGV